MGLFSGLTEIAGGLIGTAVGGPAGGALGSSLGGIVGNQLDNNRTGRLNNRQAKKDYALHRKRFEHTVADAKLLAYILLRLSVLAVLTPPRTTHLAYKPPTPVTKTLTQSKAFSLVSTQKTAAATALTTN